ncbi:DUF3289 family protein [Erwiniaceae bacterium BAC15a-03b]|uniref:DUF3289 family protein n=1 Tax=Winslowiella arboricola TaxID=2978220 RepID=A0A9J6PT71_9GAMM|nr:DUF3289 family protein [Winslowiella arboricola]MCU5774650.1 DUF3289 family protein [Winslowiella arboricola]MCU5777940.1 DUF3289 family protein [Winslowiella arboricola]
MAISIPCQVFSTQKIFGDHAADDMQYGDLSEQQLRDLKLTDISARVDPYTLTIYQQPLMLPARGFGSLGSVMTGAQTSGRKISQSECARILFDEMRELSTFFASGRYAHLIAKMIAHFETGKGTSFQSYALDEAYRDIIQENPVRNTLNAIKIAIIKSLRTDRAPISETLNFVRDAQEEISKTRLPKFTRFSDNFNGLGITIHDIHAQEITVNSLDVGNSLWRAKVSFKAQDHFGLDKSDISKPLFRNFRFFRIWFVLQRYERFGFQPFMNDFSTEVEIEGYKNEKVW